MTRLLAAFRERAGRDAEGAWSAPGRVNLIGEHTDHNDGHVLPFAIGLRTRVALARRDDRRVRCWSLQQADAAETDLGTPASARGWAAYPLGTLWALRSAGVDVGGIDLLVDGDVPLGAGLSSSAALECAVAVAVSELTGAGLDLLALARVGQWAEHEVVGAPVGLMDQVASLAGRAGHALLFDCRTHALTPVPLPLTGHRLLVVDPHLPHDLAAGGYADRRAACAAAARALGVPALRDATLPMLASLDPVLRRRARHVVTEQQRVLDVVAALRTGDMVAVGESLTQSHRSLRDDFEVSLPALDALVDAALAAGAFGARLVGGGFGGSVLALVPEAAVDTVRAAVRRLVADATVYDVVPSAGAHREA